MYFHARSCTRMTPQEVTRILQDPHAVPDSDDEEDRVQWKVRLFTKLVQHLLLLRLTAVMCLSVASSSHHAMCCLVLRPHNVSASFHMYRLNRL